MPHSLPSISGQEAIRALQRLGFQIVRQRGSHVILKKRISNVEEISCVVPLHSDLATGTLRGILKQARITSEDLVKNL